MKQENRFKLVRGGKREQPSLPEDGPLLSLADVAAYLRRSVGAVRKIMDGREDGDDQDLREILRKCVVRLSARRTYIAREPFLTWLRERAERAGSSK